MFLYDAGGLLVLILTGTFFLFLPLATGALAAWMLDAIKSVVWANRPVAEAQPSQSENAPRAQKMTW